VERSLRGCSFVEMFFLQSAAGDPFILPERTQGSNWLIDNPVAGRKTYPKTLGLLLAKKEHFSTRDPGSA
jgi:hypothetical protein